MTTEEAIKHLAHKIAYYRSVSPAYGEISADAVRIEALEMAIEALKQPEIIKCRDCIYGDSEGLMQIGDKFFAMYRCERSHDLEKGMSYCGHARRREE